MTFRFRMRPLSEVAPWGGEAPVLHWFALTDGWYWIEIGSHELFRRSGDDDLPYADYYVARLWEDILGMAADVLEPVPDDLAWFIEREDISVEAGSEDLDDLPEPCWTALSWHAGHTLYTGPLRVAPLIRMWRRAGDRDEVIVTWRNPEDDEVAFVSPCSGRVALPTSEFVAAIEDFGRRVITAMEERVAELERRGAPDGVELDLGQLRTEHVRRATFPQMAMSRVPATDWTTVRSGAKRLQELWSGSADGIEPRLWPGTQS
ncbi:DUF5984 family protein [Nonomuraea purpurea]|uniref:DUF5984 family protein n=1 Tax=Nonomuraea purpurea TaxID=1849276 RepID=A0ABV8GHE3_9ACTN